MAYFNRAVLRYKQLTYNESQSSDANSDNSNSSMSLNLTAEQKSDPVLSDPTLSKLKDDRSSYDHQLIIHDYDMVLKLDPSFVYAYFNRANLRCAQHDFAAAILDYNAAIERDPDFAEAYFNRGLARLSQGDANRGISDLSKAGELGIFDAYSIIKRMSSR